MTELCYILARQPGYKVNQLLESLRTWDRDCLCQGSGVSGAMVELGGREQIGYDLLPSFVNFGLSPTLLLLPLTKALSTHKWNI